VNFRRKKLAWRYRPDTVDVDEIIAAVRKAGYDAHTVQNESRAEDKARQAAAYWTERLRFRISVALTLPSWCRWSRCLPAPGMS